MLRTLKYYQSYINRPRAPSDLSLNLNATLFCSNFIWHNTFSNMLQENVLLYIERTYPFPTTILLNVGTTLLIAPKKRKDEKGKTLTLDYSTAACMESYVSTHRDFRQKYF